MKSWFLPLLDVRPVDDTPAERIPDFPNLLGPDAWARVSAPVRRRFDYLATGAADEHYTGAMDKMRVSRAGRWIAWLTRLIGTPLAPRAGGSVPVDVRVYRDTTGAGVVWERRYRYPDGEEAPVRSRKCVDAAGRLVETARHGIGMVLTVAEEGGGIVFTSTHYRLRIAGVNLHLPDWLSPGKMVVTHHAIDDSRFRFTLRAVHPWFGETFYQEGLFDDA